MNIVAAVTEKKLFVLDTNVLMHDPTAIFRFKEHDIYIPMVVLEELDKAKKGLSELSRNVRQVSRFLDDLLQHMDLTNIGDGIPLVRLEYATRIDEATAGRLFLQVRQLSFNLPTGLAGNMPDNSILGAALALTSERPDIQVILVSKDINLRIKAAALSIRAEDYHNDQVLEDINLLYSGACLLPDDFWQRHGGKHAQQDNGRTFFRVQGPLVAQWNPCEFVYQAGESDFEALVRSVEGNSAILELLQNFREGGLDAWGVHARNREQNFALNVLTSPEIDFVTLLGSAGTGKTLLALAAGMTQTMDEKRYREIIMTRETIPIGEDIGFLPGTEEEKMAPWMGALLDNLELLAGREDNGGSWEKAATHDVLLKRVKVRSLNFMRGRTFLNRYIILDEAQNLTPKQMKTLVTRAGPGTKVICIGNIGQIDSPYLTGTTSGLTYAVDRFKSWPHAAHMTLKRGERSRLADFASEHL